MSLVETEQKVYKDKEIPGLVYRLTKNGDILSYLKRHPWSYYGNISRALKIDKRSVSFLLMDFEMYGLLKSDMRVVRKPISKKRLGLAGRHYALSDDFEKRIAEVTEAIKTSQNYHYKRIPEESEFKLSKEDQEKVDERIRNIKANLHEVLQKLKSGQLKKPE